jgi:hypothetical protein
LGIDFAKCLTYVAKRLGVGEFRKTRHPRNIELNEVLEI